MEGTAGKNEARFAPLDFPVSAPCSEFPGLFDAVFEESEAGIFILDLELAGPHLRIADVNARLAGWLGIDRDRLAGRNFLSLIDRESNPDDLGRLSRAAIRHERVDCSLTLIDAAGAPVRGDFSLKPVAGRGANPRMVALFRRSGMSLHEALARAERERAAAEEVRQRILSRMSHELRTPLNGILGFAQLIGAAPDECDVRRYRGYATDIEAAGRELLTRIEDLLSASREQAALQPAAEGDIDLGGLLQRQLRRAMMMLGGRSLERRLEPGLPRIRACAGEISRMVELMLENALRTAPRGSRILVEAALDSSGALKLAVGDEGETLTMSDIDEALPLRDDGSDVHVTRQGRQAYGLPMVRAVAERHGGRFEIGAAHGGAGTLCVVTIPAWRVLR